MTSKAMGVSPFIFRKPQVVGSSSTARYTKKYCYFFRDIDKAQAFENEDDLYPTIYRIDRIRQYQITDEHFQVRYADRFEE